VRNLKSGFGAGNFVAGSSDPSSGSPWIPLPFPPPDSFPSPTMTRSTPNLHQGDCIRLTDDGDRCWLRAWPLARQGSPVFEVSLRQLQASSHRRPHGATCRS
jgi:hypothetical protein